MSKAILILDHMPTDCSDCLLHYDYLHCIVFENSTYDTDEAYCNARRGLTFTHEFTHHRPSLCPLIKLNKKKEALLND